MKQRQSYRDFTHLEERIERAKANLMEGYNELPKCTDCEKVRKRDRTGEICMELDLALNMVRSAIKREETAKRVQGVYKPLNWFYDLIPQIKRITKEISRRWYHAD